jgi:uncharacterized protein YkwD
MVCANADTSCKQLMQTDAEAAVLCLINEQRAAVGVAPLTLNLKLVSAARQQAKDAATIKWWGPGADVHTNPVTGSTPAIRIKAAGYCPGEATPPMAENAYWASYVTGNETLVTPQAAVNWWMGSQGHRTTLLDPVYRETGVAVVPGIPDKGSDAPGGYIFVQTFGGCSTPEVAHVGDGWAWGVNNKGQLGDGTTINRLTPVRPPNFTGIVAVAGGGYHSLAITSDGRVWSWGFNEVGQLGDSSTNDRSTPDKVVELSDVTAIAGGGFHSLALKSDGTVWAWGSNSYGQLGDGTNDNRPRPVKMLGFQGKIIAISAGFLHSLVLREDGQILGCGRNEYGALGLGTTMNWSIPVELQELSRVTAIAAGFDHSLALTSDGNVWSCGANACGQLGDGTKTNRLSRIQVMVPGGPVAKIAAGGVHSLALQAANFGSGAAMRMGSWAMAIRLTPCLPCSPISLA